MGEPETNVGASAGGPLMAFSDEYPESTSADPLDPPVIALTVVGAEQAESEWHAGWLESLDPPVIAFTDE